MKYVKLAITLFTETDLLKVRPEPRTVRQVRKAIYSWCNIVRSFRQSHARKSHLQVLRCSNGYSRQTETDQVARTKWSVAGHSGVFICFFESVSAHLDGIDAMVLRSCLCDYLDSNFAAYIEFLMGDTDNENDRYLRYFLNVEQLRTPGTWSNDAGDLLPLALADWSRRTVKIFTSNLYRPVIIVHPQDINNESQCEITPITLSLLELEAPHYETVFPLSPKRFTVPAFSDNTSGIQVPESEKTTPDKTMIHSSPGTRQASFEQKTSTPPATFPPHMETPRKQGTFKTPPRKELFRRKLAMPNQWKKNSRKVL